MTIAIKSVIKIHSTDVIYLIEQQTLEGAEYITLLTYFIPKIHV